MAQDIRVILVKLADAPQHADPEYMREDKR
jgi:hypothetical protein